MPDYQPRFFAGVAGPVVRPITYGPIRDVVQDLHDASREELQRVREDVLAVRAGQQVSNAGLVARWLKAGVRYAALTVIATIISAPVEREVDHLMGWDAPPVTVVRQMTHEQMNELARQIEQQLEKQERKAEQQEHKDHRDTHGPVHLP